MAFPPTPVTPGAALQGAASVRDSAGRREADLWNDVAADWQERSRAALWRAHSDAVYTTLLQRWLPAGAIDSVLKTDLFDEAVSAGLYDVLAARARLIVGIDLAHLTARQALRRHPAMGAATADVRTLPFASGSFDTVVSLSTLDHFRSHSDLEAGLAELRRVLRPGGVLILTLDNLANPLIRLRNALPFAVVHGARLVPYYVGRSCSPATAEAIVAQHGFRIDARTTVLHVPRVAAVPAAALAERWGGSAARARLLSALGGWERLGQLPTRALTGHYVALRATKLSA